jgi:hypothetical protein
VIALVVLWRLRYKLNLRDLAEMFLIRGFVFTYEARPRRRAHFSFLLRFFRARTRFTYYLVSTLGREPLSRRHTYPIRVDVS